MDNNISEELSALSKKVEALSEKVEGHKKRDGWDKLQIIASFISSILFAGVGLYFTKTYNDREAKREEDMQKATLQRADREEVRQVEMQNIQKDIAQLEAIIRLTPLLTSKDKETKQYALMTLQALYNKKAPIVPLQPDTLKVNPQATVVVAKPVTPDQSPSLSILSYFAAMALTENASLLEKKGAVKSVRDIAINPNATSEVKKEAIGIMTKLAVSEKLPDEVRKVAEDYLKEIVSMPGNAFDAYLNKEHTNRKVDEIILHHTFMPAIKNYKGEQIINSMVKFQIEDRNWTYAGWHFMISPDGLIWTGRPISVNWTGIANYRNEAISVTLLLNGDEELPTEEQKKSLVIVVKALCEKFNIAPESNFSATRGFHRDHNMRQFAEKSCPGKLLTKELVLSWLNASGKDNGGTSTASYIRKSMTRDELLDDLKKLIVEKLAVEYEEIKMESNFTDDLAADDLDVVEIIIEVEKRYNISIPDEIAEKMTTVKSIFDYLENIYLK